MATRTNAKQMFVDALNKDFLAEGFAKFLDVPLPEFDNTAMDAGAAIEWEGKLSRYLCQVFTLFEGLFPLEIPLRMGQKNATQQGMLLAALEATRTVGHYYSGDIQAAATAIKDQLEGFPATNSPVQISREEMERLQFGGLTLKEMIESETLESEFLGGDVIHYVESLNKGIGEAMGNIVDDIVTLSAEALRNLTSISRLIWNTVVGED